MTSARNPTTLEESAHAFSSYGWQGSSTRVRLYDWFQALALHPIIHEYMGLPDNRPGRLLRAPTAVAAAELRLRRTDVTGRRVIVCREASPFSRGQIERRLLTTASHGVFDFDDAIFLPAAGPRNLTNPLERTKLSVISADVVIAGNEYLADWAGQYSTSVRVIPSCVDPSAYPVKEKWDIGADGPRIAWLGSPSTEQYVASVASALREVCRITGARIVLISGPGDNPALASLQPFLDRVPWSVEAVHSALVRADVAIAPLDDSDFAAGKCAYKLLQYAAVGLPVVASPVGANHQAVMRFDGLAPETLNEWVDALRQLIEEPASRREQRGRTALGAVAEHYSFASWTDAWCDATGFRHGSAK